MAEQGRSALKISELTLETLKWLVTCLTTLSLLSSATEFANIYCYRRLSFRKWL